MYEKSPTILPPCLQTRDVIRIDGEWAQICSYTGERSLVRFLGKRDRNSSKDIYWEEYELVKPILKPVMEIEKRIPERQRKRILWGSEQKRFPYLRGHVRVFGEYKSKKR